MLYEYRCPNNHISEYITNLLDRKLPKVCKVCGNEAVYIISAPRVKLEGISGDFPGAYAKWEKVHMEKLKQEKQKKVG